MRRIAILTIASAGLAGGIHAPEAFAGTYGNAPWCAVMDMGTGNIEWDCQYQTAEQCAPMVIAGNRGFCNHNPYWTQAAPTPPVTHRKHHHG